jgi:hypothetical protein
MSPILLGLAVMCWRVRQRIGGGAVAEPPQPQHTACQKQVSARLPSGVPRRLALGQQQLRKELRQFPWDVKRGTIGDHVELSSGSRFCGETSSTGAPRPFPDSPVRPRVCLDAHLWAKESPAFRTYFAEITSVRGVGLDDDEVRVVLLADEG